LTPKNGLKKHWSKCCPISWIRNRLCLTFAD